MSLIIHCMMMDDDNDNDTHHTSNTNPTSIHEHESLKNMIMIREKNTNIFRRMVRFRWRLDHLSTSYIVLYNWLDQERAMEMLWFGVGYNKGDPA